MQARLRGQGITGMPGSSWLFRLMPAGLWRRGVPSPTSGDEATKGTMSVGENSNRIQESYLIQ